MGFLRQGLEGLDPKGRFGLVCATLKTFLPIFLPGFFLLAAAGAPGLDRWTHHREAFGSENYFLAIAFAGSPDGILSPGTPSRFFGSLVTAKGEFAVRGERETRGGAHYYRIYSQAGEFEGRTADASCGSPLYLKPGKMITAGLQPETLRSGSCP